MNNIINFLLFLGLCYFANAQWRGDIGYQRVGRNWELRGGARYEINRGRTNGHFGGHGFINSNGQRGWGVNAGIKKTFAGGRGSWGVQGFRNSNGGYGARATFRYRFRGRRSVEQDDQMNKACSECVTIKTIASPEQLQEYTSFHKIDFAMITRFKNFYFDAKETRFYFKIKNVLEAPPSEVNITQAKVFSVLVDTSSCALACLKGITRQDFIVTGAMFHGRLIIHDKLLLLHIVDPDKETGEEKEGTEETDHNAEGAAEGSHAVDQNKSRSKLTGNDAGNEGKQQEEEKKSLAKEEEMEGGKKVRDQDEP